MAYDANSIEHAADQVRSSKEDDKQVRGGLPCYTVTKATEATQSDVASSALIQQLGPL